jgi:hypothetical protein
MNNTLPETRAADGFFDRLPQPPGGILQKGKTRIQGRAPVKS